MKKTLTRRDGIVLAIVEEIESLYDGNEDSEPVETVIETFVGELMDEVERNSSSGNVAHPRSPKPITPTPPNS